MSKVVFNAGIVRIDDVVMTREEFEAIRPSFQIPDVVTAEYTGSTHFQSDGWNQSRGPIPWPEADALILEKLAVKQDLEAHRAAQEGP